MKTLLLLCLLVVSQEAVAWCGPIQLSGFSPVPPNGGSMILSQTSIYIPSGFYWGTALPADTSMYVTDIIFQSKNVRYEGTGTRSSYLVVNGLVTVAEHMGGQIHMRTPMTVPPGFFFDGAFINQSPEEQNMIAILTGYVWDSETCRQNFR